VFEAGIRFEPESDESAAIPAFVSAAAGSGFLGAALPQPIFVRRRRPEGLVEPENDNVPGPGSTPDLVDVRAALALQHKHCPRFFLAFADTNRFFLCTDPAAARETTFAECERSFFASGFRPEEAHFPPVAVVTTERKWKALAAAGLAHFVLWDLERRIGGGKAASLTFMAYPVASFSTNRAPLDYRRADPDSASPFHDDVVAVATGEIRKLISNSGQNGSPGGAGGRLLADPDRAVLRGPADLVGERPILRVTDVLAALCEQLRQSRFRASLQSGSPGEASRQRTSGHGSGGGTLYPLLPRQDALDIAFVTPFFDFGGVERVTTAIADVLRRRGFRTHLVVVGTSPIHRVGNALRAFETLNWLPIDRALATSDERYGGTRLSGWDDPAEQRALVNLLAGMDVVINEHSGATHAISGELKRRGILLMTHEHVVEVSRFGRPHGPPFRALAYAGNYDRVLACSRQLADWLFSMGVPRSKLIELPNGPGFRTAEEPEPERAFAFDTRPIRLMFIGRLDRQKGVDRLRPLLEGLERAGVAVEMKIVGKAVVEAADVPSTWPANVRLHRPVYDDDELRRLYAWADIVLIPSRYEGLPLTISEAQAAGAIVIATDVGAVAEAIVNGETGFVFPEDSYVTDAIATIAELAGKPEEGARISAQARSRAPNWDAICEPLVRALQELAVERAAERGFRPGRRSPER